MILADLKDDGEGENGAALRYQLPMSAHAPLRQQLAARADEYRHLRVRGYRVEDEDDDCRRTLSVVAVALAGAAANIRGRLLWVSAIRAGRASENTTCRHNKITEWLREAGLGAIADLGSTTAAEQPDDHLRVQGSQEPAGHLGAERGQH
ncbi:hypothetical protein ABT174_37985 [Streptomyces sparsogenes]|uniref:hypothetical protein n=1 Tax=Streptomyces sparsogenes TaxID=67365 RepID=UPI003325CB45